MAYVSCRQKMILSILTPCNENGNETYKEGIEYKSDNDMVEIIQPAKKAKGNPKAINDELIWTEVTRSIACSQQLGEGLQCKENYDLKVECKDVCFTSNKQCTNKRIKNKNWKSVEKRQTENGKEYGLFVKENCKEGDIIIEYVGKVVRKIRKGY